MANYKARWALPQSNTAGSRAPDKVLLGTTKSDCGQYGIMGRHDHRMVGLDLDGCHTVGVFGVQGAGKSYTVGAIAEMAVMAAPPVNQIASPLATVYFHYHRTDRCPPEHVSSVQANDVVSDVAALDRLFGAKPMPVPEVLVLVPPGKLRQRRAEFPHLAVEPLLFGPSELGADEWRDLLCASTSDAFYVRQVLAMLRRERNNIRIENLREALAAGALAPAVVRLAQERLEMAAEYLQDGACVGRVLKAGRTIVVDLRDEWIEKDDALALFLTLMRVFTKPSAELAPFNRLLIFDEAHKYMSDNALTETLVEAVREMRHLGTSILIASQDPISVPQSVLELSSVLMLHRMTSPRWLKHLQGAVLATKDIRLEDLAALPPGEAFVWAQQCTDRAFTTGMQRLRLRPRLSKHGGETVRATAGLTPDTSPHSASSNCR